MLGVNVDFTGSQVLWELFGGLVSLKSVHLLNFLLCLGALNLTTVKADLQVSLLELVKAHLVALSVLHLILLFLLVFSL